MLVEQNSTTIFFNSENTSSLEKNLSTVISHDDNTPGINQNEVLPLDKKTLSEKKIFIRVSKITCFFATVTKIKLEGDITYK